ncbi:FtsX-like permease family protein [Coprococcus sp. AF21-14LB]|uniref:FtsX-like permease family protein n=1 Tax=Coprococcus sp. AF21-14LB TaxID=2292231 RepID=UPI000E4FCC07|nr:ABC transporter permease [Coprococcus sp. AF21-14LB]RGS81681.1 ABC transporter permease [Coprococcus sp. AF21-14LB]
MMLFSLSIKNMKKSIKDYGIYFFTLVIGVAIFYVFNSLETQTVMEQLSESTKSIIILMTRTLEIVSVFVAAVIGFLMVYANRFLIRRRKKEFGVYLLLGMGKGAVSRILFFETVFIGVISLAVGLCIGVFGAQLASIAVANMFQVDMSRFTFTFSPDAFGKTILYFSIMYVIVMIFNTVSVRRSRPIELLQSGRKNEELKMKNTTICTIVFLIAVLVLGHAYWQVTGGVEEMQYADAFITPILEGIVATFLIFWSLSGLLLKFVMNAKRIYFRALHSFTLRQLHSKIHTMVFSMTVTCLMLFLTICVLSAGLALNETVKREVEENVPKDVQITAPGADVETKIQKAGADLTLLKEPTTVRIYENGLTMGDTLSDSVKKEFPMLAYEMKEEFVPLSEYNRLAEQTGQKTYELEENQYVLLASFEQMAAVRNRSIQEGIPVTIDGKVYESKYDVCQNGYVGMAGSRINTGIYIVPDEAVKNMTCVFSVLTADYNVPQKEKKETEKAFLDKLYAVNEVVEKNALSQLETTTDAAYIFEISTKIIHMESSAGLGTIVTFIGIYLGIIFLISSAAVLALKELSDHLDNKVRYEMLRKIGVDEKMIHHSMLQQTAIFFGLPLLLAMIHSVFGIQFAQFLLGTVGYVNMGSSLFLTAGVIVLIYGGYFLITYMTEKRMLRED